MSIRAVRNNNPGNIRAHDAWQGLLPRAQMNHQQAAETEFAVFAAPRWGFRAMAIVLLNYVRVHHLTTVRAIIGRWAPPSENLTDAYVLDVAHAIGLGADTPADFTKPDLLAALAKAIARHEAGHWLFSDADLKAGIALAEISEGARVA